MLTQFHATCLALAKAIEDGVAKNEVPNITRDLPEALKQVCRRNHDSLSKSMIMFLLFSARTACKLGWFSEDDAHEISKLADEMSTCFCGTAVADVCSILSESSLVPTIMSRFYPSLRLGKILASLEVKPGYGTYICDFHILRDDFLHSVKEEVRLLVARMDITETSSCLVSPQQVSFLMNGAPVGSRTCVNMIPGPQLPTNVTTLLKYGTNLLQAVGKFDGPCVILVAFMNMVNECHSSSLPQYVPWNAAVPDSVVDSDLIEGPSRISLKCPISLRRIKLPVKGHSCRHPQCFDFGNFVDMNSRRPSWRCPHCNQSVCYPDIRMDQTLAKILQEVGDDIAEVIISADGSWRAVVEASDDESPANREEAIAGPVVNLIDIDDHGDVDPVYGSEERKPLQSYLPSSIGIVNPELAGGQDSAIAGSLNAPTQPSNLVSDVPTSISTSWVGPTSDTFPQILTPAVSDVPTSINTSWVSPTSVTFRQILTPAVSNHARQSVGDFNLQEALLPTASAGFASLPLGVNANAFDVEYGHISNLRPVNITRVPIAVQALPVPSHIRMLAGQRARSTGNQSMPNVYPIQNLLQQPMVRSYPRVVSSDGPSAAMFSQSSNAPLPQSLNQYQSASTRTHSPPVSQPCQMNIQNSLNGEQASPGMPSQFSVVHSQIQGFAASNSSGPAAFSDQNLLLLGRMRGSLSSQAMDNLSPLIIKPTQVVLPTGQPSGYPAGTQQPSALPHLQKNL